MKKERLRIENIRKGTLLKRIELQVFEGEIIHCVFDNIQEKTMFLELMTGARKADYGRVYYEEEKVPEKDMSSVLRKRVALISRESRLIDSVSMEENMFLVRPRVKGHWVNRRSYRKARSCRRKRRKQNNGKSGKCGTSDDRRASHFLHHSGDRQRCSEKISGPCRKTGSRVRTVRRRNCNRRI